MRRRHVLLGLAGAAATWPLAGRAQQRVRARIGYLISGSLHTLMARRSRDAFRQGLQELGYVEGQNITVESRFAEGHFDRLAGLAAELIRLEVDVIVAAPSPAAAAAKKATQTIPIVIVNVGDPIGLGLIDSLAHPGGNVTGLSHSVGMETFGKGLELLKDAAPHAQKIAILSNPTNPAHALASSELVIAAQRLAMQVRVVEARVSEEFELAFATMVKEEVGGLFVVPDGLFVRDAEKIAHLAVKNRLPSMHGLSEEVEAGGLMSYGPASADLWRGAAAFVHKILNGAKPADLPVQQPSKFELVINLKTAKALGLEIPPTLLSRADEVIE